MSELTYFSLKYQCFHDQSYFGQFGELSLTRPNISVHALTSPDERMRISSDALNPHQNGINCEEDRNTNFRILVDTH